MVIFTTKEYLRYNDFFQIMLGLNEETVEYEYEKTHQYHDKIFKDVLDNKGEIINLLRNYIEKNANEITIGQDDIERYNRKFITGNYKNKEADIIYKLKEKNVFILVEHQSTIDYEMPERITRILFRNNKKYKKV